MYYFVPILVVLFIVLANELLNITGFVASKINTNTRKLKKREIALRLAYISNYALEKTLMNSLNKQETPSDTNDFLKKAEEVANNDIVFEMCMGYIEEQCKNLRITSAEKMEIMVLADKLSQDTSPDLAGINVTD